jgi:hypothetical protein
MNDTEFMQWLRDHNSSLIELADVGDGRWVSIERLLFHYTIKSGTIGDTIGYDDRWCMADLPRAIVAFAEWKSRKFEGEPTGWRRHPNTGRRRNDDGDPSSEEINF